MDLRAAKKALRILKRRLRFAYFKSVLSIYRLLFFSIRNFDEKYIVESTRRQQWFYRSKFPVFAQKHFLDFAPDINAEDLQIVGEIHSYWKKLKDTIVPDQTIWTLDLQGATGLVECLNGDNTPRLARVLKNMFHSSYIQGISHGFRHKEFLSSKMLVPVVTEDRLVSLAEYLGVVPVETSEQGICGLAMQYGLEAIVARIEDALGISIAFPENFGASGIRVGDRTISKRQIEHIYGACRLKENIRNFSGLRGAPSLVEIGGGYGGLCLWIKRIFGEELGKYYIIDLPWVNTFQAFFLKTIFGKEEVAFWNDGAEKIAAASVILCSSLGYREYFATVQQAQIYLNQDSLPEMPESVARDYLDWIFSKRGAVFFSYQQENGVAVNGVAQNSVHTLLRKCPRANLLARNLSWTRDGYSEETYAVN